MKLSADQPLSRLNGDFKLSDIMEMLQAFFSMFQAAESPLSKLKDLPMFPVPVPFIPPVPPIFPVFPMPFWGWGGKKRTAAEKQGKNPEAPDGAGDNEAETADNEAD